MSLGWLGIYRRCDEGTARYDSLCGKRILMRPEKEVIMPVGHLRFKVTIAVSGCCKV